MELLNGEHIVVRQVDKVGVTVMWRIKYLKKKKKLLTN